MPEVPPPVIGGRWARLKEIIAEVVTEKGAWLVELETMTDQCTCWWRWIRSLGVHNW